MTASPQDPLSPQPTFPNQPLPPRLFGDADPSAVLGAGVTVIGRGVVSPPVTRFDVAGANDLVRYKIAPDEGVTGFIHFQLCQPLWAPN